MDQIDLSVVWPREVEHMLPTATPGPVFAPASLVWTVTCATRFV